MIVLPENESSSEILLLLLLSSAPLLLLLLLLFIQQTFIACLLCLRHCARCHGNYKVNKILPHLNGCTLIFLALF